MADGMLPVIDTEVPIDDVATRSNAWKAGRCWQIIVYF